LKIFYDETTKQNQYQLVQVDIAKVQQESQYKVNDIHIDSIQFSLVQYNNGYYFLIKLIKVSFVIASFVNFTKFFMKLNEYNIEDLGWV